MQLLPGGGGDIIPTVVGGLAGGPVGAIAGFAAGRVASQSSLQRTTSPTPSRGIEDQLGSVSRPRASAQLLKTELGG